MLGEGQSSARASSHAQGSQLRASAPLQLDARCSMGRVLSMKIDGTQVSPRRGRECARMAAVVPRIACTGAPMSALEAAILASGLKYTWRHDDCNTARLRYPCCILPRVALIVPSSVHLRLLHTRRLHRRQKQSHGMLCDGQSPSCMGTHALTGRALANQQPPPLSVRSQMPTYAVLHRT